MPPVGSGPFGIERIPGQNQPATGQSGQVSGGAAGIDLAGTQLPPVVAMIFGIGFPEDI